MYAVNTYEQIQTNERIINENHIIILMFVRPNEADSDTIIKSFNYLHHNSSKYCSIYAVGYTNDESSFRYYDTVKGVNCGDWYYSDEAFVEFKNKLEDRIKWRYSGENELIILQSNIDNPSNILNFQNYVAVNISQGIRMEYIESYSNFMENLIRQSKEEVNSKKAVDKAVRFSANKIATLAIEESKQIPTPIKRIINNTLFFKTSQSYGKRHLISLP